MKSFTICPASAEHLPYVEDVVRTIEEATQTKGTGLAWRSPEYIRSKIEEGKAVIALHKGAFAGFCYIECWEHSLYVATSGLIVRPEYRGRGLASAIKKEAFLLARHLFPSAKMFGLTTSLPVMRINSSLGFVPVTFTELTTDQQFWKGCETCQYYDVLQRSGNKNCLCTGMLFDPTPKRKRVVVAFSGGLDTSYTVMYLAREKGYEVYAACADTGGFTPEQLRTNEENALKLGAKSYITLDVKEEYYRKSLRYMVYGNVLRGGTYPISVSSERLFQAAAIARYAKEIGADAIAHGSTGAGNDQVRFDMTFSILCPEMEIITLTRDQNLSRQKETDYLRRNGFPANFAKLKYSYNIGLWGTSICGGEILDSTQGLPEEAYLKPVTKSDTTTVQLGFEKGELCSVNGEALPPVKAIQKLEATVEGYGLGRDNHVGDTIIGIKGRVGFEAAAPMLILAAHKYLEKFTLSKWQQYWKEQLGNWYGMFLHESQYWEPVMRDIEAYLESSQRNVSGTVTLTIGPKWFECTGVDTPGDLVNNPLGAYGEGQDGWSADEAKGFIRLLEVPLKVYYGKHPDEAL